jgi:ABC-type hemin transport system substrate-binding protein
MAGQRPIFAILATLCGFLAGCDASDPPVNHGIASATPAATDVLLQLDAGHELVGVSSYDASPLVAELPRVGDAESLDWEQLAMLRPRVLMVGTATRNLPAGTAERADELGIELVNVRVDRLADLRTSVGVIANTVGSDPVAAVARFDREVAEAAGDLRHDTPPKVLIMLDERLSFAVGRDNYIDDLLHNIGGINAVPVGRVAYPTLGRETLLSLDVDAVVLVLPGDEGRRTREAEANWKTLPADWAVPWKEVVVVTDAYALTPGWTGAIVLTRALREAVEPPKR